MPFKPSAYPTQLNTRSPTKRRSMELAVSSGIVPCDGSLHINSAFTGSAEGAATDSIQMADLGPEPH